MEVLRVEGLSKNFGGVKALHDVSFKVERGEKLAIIGPNGAGKTTLFNVISGWLFATTGRLYLSGQEIGSMAPHNRAQLGLGRSFQINSLFFNLTLLDNILLAVQGTKPGRFQMFRPISANGDLLARAQRLLRSMHLWEKRDSLVKDISYGEQRRLEIALSLASEPKLLLLDEPSAGLTAGESASIVGIINNLGSNIAVLIVAHDMDLVFGVANRVIVLHYGQIIAEGTPKQMQAHPKVKEIYLGEEGK